MKIPLLVASFFVGGACVLAGFALEKNIKKQANKPAQEMQFVCFDDGKLVEQQVGVERAFTYGYSHQVWYIKYVDSDIVVNYHQPMGETCYVEELE